MTRKDYKLIALALYKKLSGILNSDTQMLQKRNHSIDVVWDIANYLAQEFEVENSRFNRITFLNACGFPLENGAYTPATDKDLEKVKVILERETLKNLPGVKSIKFV